MPLVIYGRKGRHTHPHETRNQAHAWPACAWFKKLAVEVLINALPFVRIFHRQNFVLYNISFISQNDNLIFKELYFSINFGIKG